MSEDKIDKIVKHIQMQLRGKEWPLKDGEIESEILKHRTILDNLDDSTVSALFSIKDYSKLTDSEWWSVKRQLETMNNVKNKQGSIIVNSNRSNHDDKWWTDKYRQKCDNYYWNRYRKYIKDEVKLPFDTIRALDIDTDKIMNNIENPLHNSFSNFGMVVGHVQSGKTGNYTGLICKAADAGYKLIIIIAGSINNLREQTQKRINENFIGKNIDTYVGVSKVDGFLENKTPKCLTTMRDDFSKGDIDKFKQLINFDNESEPVVMVIKKNTNSLESVNKWLRNKNNEKILNHAMLVVDDESDYASINTKENEITAINSKIRNLINKFEKSAYVAYTATPYANIFIDHNSLSDEIGEDLFPKDFIYLLEAADNYFGAKKVFIDKADKYLVEIDPPSEIPANHKKDDILPNLPDSMKDAIRLYIINVAIRTLKGDSSKHHSMLIHATRFTRFHMQITIQVQEYLDILRKEVRLYGKLKNSCDISSSIKDLKNTYIKTFKKYPIKEEWPEIIKCMADTIELIIVREVHSGKDRLSLEYKDEAPTYAIVIGGTSLSRGYTIEGLSVSYFYRNSNYYDTLLQMARWFGYRNNYEDICRIYMTSEMKDKFQTITTYTEELYEDFREMERQNKSPEVFGLAVKQHPGSALLVTARNKSRNAEDIILEMSLDGSLKETSWLLKDKKAVEYNYDLLKELLTKLSKIKSYETVGSTLLWRDINKDLVFEFINKFKVFSRDAFDILSRMPKNCIIEYINQYELKWDIALYSGEEEDLSIIQDITIKREKRTLVDKTNYYEVKNRQVSSGDAESIVLEPEKRRLYKNKRKAVRANMEKPLLMLHVIKYVDIELKVTCEKIVAFGISFPGGVERDKKLVKVKANTVMIESMKRQLEEDEYDD